MSKHELALQHAMKALILIQDELVSKFERGGSPQVKSDPMTEASNRD